MCTLVCSLTKKNAGQLQGSLCDKGCYNVQCCRSCLPWIRRAVLDTSLCQRSDMHFSSALDTALKMKPKASWAAARTEGRFADDGWHWQSPLGSKAHRGQRSLVANEGSECSMLLALKTAAQEAAGVHSNDCVAITPRCKLRRAVNRESVEKLFNLQLGTASLCQPKHTTAVLDTALCLRSARISAQLWTKN